MENKSAVPPSYGPRPGRRDAVAPISKARAAVLSRLREIDGTLSVEQLALQTGQHANTAREHLEALVENGYATRTAAPKEGRGRPAWLYQPSPVPAGPVGYAALAAALAQHLATHSENPAAEGEAAGRAWARAMPAAGSNGTSASGDGLAIGAGTAKGARSANRAQPSAAAAKATRSHVATALEQAGFGVQKNRDATELTLTVCPIVEAARENPDVVCAVHLGLVKELLVGSGSPEDDVELLPFAGPGICTLHMRQSAGQTGAGQPGAPRPRSAGSSASSSGAAPKEAGAEAGPATI
ncbi:metalloregulator ArsR/SmtB family transcription factor [Arthrobacter sp.]|uniref:helix-turn-helix transcriptional regulator n=1 Tax=Arthrobacter sp. TaxID=1667 RepID=UPI0026DF9B65|nr:helix-turn-helix domain-containing protein [Arthrobacter sp.]MDO5753688.1 helix-turn-helix domain-containing protein [Arthrobacter sp.]